jgi:alpha-tubulin suppressor-like RCC1 family protein
MSPEWRRLGLAIATTCALLTVAASAPAAGPSVTAIAAGYRHTCALLSGGVVKCWGSNYNGQLGDGTKAERHSAVAVLGLPTGVRTLAAGGAHTCALLAGAGVECWGDNEYGQLGDGTVTLSEAPRAVSGLASGALAIAAGAAHTCAVVSGGGVKCWGNNQYEQLGDGTTTNRDAPVEVSGLAGGVQAVTGGALHTCALVGGAVECWGNNLAGQLGDGTTTSRSTPVTVPGLPSGVQAIAAGAAHTCALLGDGGVKCWGDDEYGQLGDGEETNYRSTPVAVSGLASGVRAIAAGYTDTCALMTTGGVECWGNLFEDEPDTVPGLGSGVTAIGLSGDDTYEDHACATLGAGGADCWGANEYGQLGSGTAESLHLGPASVLGLASGVHVLSVLVNGRGTVTAAAGIRCAYKCGYERPQGATVVLKARAAKRSVFKSWGGACKRRKPRCTVVLSAERTVTARFVRRR